MATESFEVSRVIPATPERIYSAWLDSGEHSALTGGKATVEPGVGGRFTAWDGYIEGTTLELEPSRRIVQAWRTTEFPPDSGPSRLELNLEPVEGGTRIRLVHTDLPEGQGERYQRGWEEHYFEPMTRYFSAAVGVPAEGKKETEVPPEERPTEVKEVAEAEEKKPAKRAPAKKAQAPVRAARPAPKAKKVAAPKAKEAVAPKAKRAVAPKAKKAAPKAKKAAAPKAKRAAAPKAKRAAAPKAKRAAAKGKRPVAKKGGARTPARRR